MKTIESCGIEITHNNDKYIILAIYRPHTDTIDNFTNKINEILNGAKLKNKNVITAGDFNIDLIDHTNDVQHFINTMQSLQYIPLITKPTRHSPNTNITPSLLDQIWINKLSEYHSAIIITDITDHYPTILNLPVIHNVNKKIKLTFRSHKPENINKLITELTDWNKLFDKNSDINRQFKQLIENTNEIYRKTCPLQIKYVNAKRLQKPWLSKAILCSIKHKSTLHKLYTLGVIDATFNNKYKNMLNTITKRAKEQYYHNKFDKNIKNIKQCWSIIRKILGRDTNHSNNITITENGNEINDHKEVSELFSTYFANIATTLDNDIPLSHKSPLDYLNNPTPNSFYLNPLSTQECKTIINKLKNSNYGRNSISTKLLKIIDPLIYPITHLINESIQQSIFPDILKIGIITPIFKEGDKKQVSNYRPITVLPLISKIFERYIASRLTKYLSKYSIITPQQYGFQKGLSTTDAIINLTEHIYTALNNREHNCTVLIDFKKAFDTVNHSILLQKLKFYGIRGEPHKLFTSYLTNRKQAVKIGETISDYKSVTIGVPQGSVLGPLLFLLYVNDLPNASNKLKTILFADDTTLSLNGANHQDLTTDINSELIKIKDWTQANRLSLNLKKTYALTITNRRHDTVAQSIVMNDKVVKPVHQTKLLGITLDSNITFEEHIHNIGNKISKSIGIIYKIKSLVPKSVLMNLYYSFVYPYLIYGIEIWGATDLCHIKSLVLLQKKSYKNYHRK